MEKHPTTTAHSWSQLIDSRRACVQCGTWWYEDSREPVGCTGAERVPCMFTEEEAQAEIVRLLQAGDFSPKALQYALQSIGLKKADIARALLVLMNREKVFLTDNHILRLNKCTL